MIVSTDHVVGRSKV